MQSSGRQEIEVALMGLMGGNHILHGRMAVDRFCRGQLLIVVGGDALA